VSGRASGVESISLALTPQGHLRLQRDAESPPLSAELLDRLTTAFDRGPGAGLLELGAREIGTVLPPVLGYWRDFAARYVTALCATVEGAGIAVAALDATTLESLVADVPPMRGAEYLSPGVLAALWTGIDAAVHEALARSKLRLPDLLKHWHPAWNLVGRVHFNLAENRKDPQAPFAFLATYTTRLSAHGRAQHQPLSAGARRVRRVARKAQLLSLLLPVQRAAAAVRVAARDGRVRRDLSPAALAGPMTHCASCMMCRSSRPRHRRAHAAQPGRRAARTAEGNVGRRAAPCPRCSGWMPCSTSGWA
jgi:hypothetical protein